MSGPYQTKMNELQSVLRALESETLSVDELTSKLKLAFSLIDDLRNQVAGIEASLEEIIVTRSTQNKPQNESGSTI